MEGGGVGGGERERVRVRETKGGREGGRKKGTERVCKVGNEGEQKVMIKAV